MNKKSVTTPKTSTEEIPNFLVAAEQKEALTGFENISQTDYKTPYLAIVQPKSTSYLQKYKCRAGDFIIDAIGLVISPDVEEVRFIPIHIEKYYEEVTPQGLTATPYKRYSTSEGLKLIESLNGAVDRKGAPKLPSGNSIIDVISILGTLTVSGRDINVMMTLKSTKLNFARSFFSLMRGQRVSITYAYSYKLSTKQHNYAAGPAYNYTVSDPVLVVDEDVFNRCAQAHSEMKNKSRGGELTPTSIALPF